MDTKVVANELVKMAKELVGYDIDIEIFGFKPGLCLLIVDIDIDAQPANNAIWGSDGSYSVEYLQKFLNKADIVIDREVARLERSTLFADANKPDHTLLTNSGGIVASSVALIKILEQVTKEEIKEELEKIGFQGSVNDNIATSATLKNRKKE